MEAATCQRQVDRQYTQACGHSESYMAQCLMAHNLEEITPGGDNALISLSSIQW